MLELADAIRCRTGSTSPITFVPRPQDDPTLRRPDFTLAREVLDGSRASRSRTGASARSPGSRRVLTWASTTWRQRRVKPHPPPPTTLPPKTRKDAMSPHPLRRAASVLVFLAALLAGCQNSGNGNGYQPNETPTSPQSQTPSQVAG